MRNEMGLLKDDMALSATGYASVIDGIMDVRTVADTQSMAALCALGVLGFDVQSNCSDPDCMCKFDLLQRLRPDVQVVKVIVTVTDWGSR